MIRNLSIIGVITLILGLLGVLSRRGPWLAAQQIAGWVLIFGCLVCVVEAVMMVWGSKVGNRRERDRLVHLLQLTGDELALDVGCGRGLILHGMAKRLRTGQAIGVDIWNARDVSGNDPAVTKRNAAAEGVADRIEIVDGDARQMPFADNTFDAVASSLVIHNIASEQERRQSIREIYRVLKPGGRFAILDFQRIGEYKDEFQNCGAIELKVHGPHFLMFPPVKIVTGRKAEVSPTR